MFKNLTPKTKGKTVKPLSIPGAKKKGSKSPAAHRRGHVAPQKGVSKPPAFAQEPVDQEESAEGSEAGESPLEEAGEEAAEHENEGGPDIENSESIADAIGKINAKRTSPRKYDAGTNTYR